MENNERCVEWRIINVGVMEDNKWFEEWRIIKCVRNGG